MDGNRGAKGSINDRLISMMYRNRYRKLQLQKESYSKDIKQEEKRYLRSIQNFDIEEGAITLDAQDRVVIEEALAPLKETIIEFPPPIKADSQFRTISQEAERVIPNIDNSNAQTLHDISEKMIEFNPDVEEFDFDRFDYYEVIENKTGIGELPATEIIDVEKEVEKVEDEIIIVDELKDFIDDSIVLIEEIKEDLSQLKSLVQEQYTENDINILEDKYNKVKYKINLLMEKYDTVKDKYNFENFEILESIEMMLALDDYKDKASLDEIETLVDFCKNEIEQIDGIVIEEKKSVGVSEEIVEKKVEIRRRDAEFTENRKGVIYLDDLEHKIAHEAREQKIIIAELEKKLSNFTTEFKDVTHTVYHTEKMFGSFLRIAAGILTSPFSGTKIFGTMLGTHLINKGIKGLRDAINPEYVKTTETIHRYKDIEREILNSKDYVNTTDRLISDSIYQLDRFDDEFKTKFRKYTGVIPEYQPVEKQIEVLKRKLSQKQLEIATMKNDLDKQYEANKIKVKKSS
jgi:hypothetical protein